MADYNIIIQEPVTQVVVVEESPSPIIHITEAVTEYLITVATGESGDLTSLEASLNAKQDKELGKGLSEENYTTTEKAKLATVSANAEENVNADWSADSGDAQILNKPTVPDALADLSQDATHRTVTDLEKITWNGKQNELGYLPVSNLTTVNDEPLSSDVVLTKAHIGLPNVDNTSDLAKPVSTAQQAALDLKENTANKAIDFSVINSTKFPTTEAVENRISEFVVGLFDDRGNYDASTNVFPSTGGSGSGGAVDKGDIWTINVGGMLGGIVVAPNDTVRALEDLPGQNSAKWAIQSAAFGFTPENVANKSVDGNLGASDSLYSSQKAVKTYADTKVPQTRTINTHALTGDINITKGDVGLPNADNTSDVNKPVSNATQAAIDAKVEDLLVNGVTTKAPSQNIVFDQLGTKQPLDTDLTAIAGLDSAQAGVVASDGAGWLRKTYAAIKTALGLVKADVGLGNVPNLDTSITSNITDSLNKRFVTDANLTTIGQQTGTNTGDQSFTPNAGGDVTGSSGAVNPLNPNLTIGNDKVTNAKLANMPALTFKMNSQVGSGDPEDGTVPTARTTLAINNVDNTTDANKPISSATQTALDTKQDDIQFQDDGSNLGTAGTAAVVNFTGAGVTASRATNTITVNVPGGGGAGANIPSALRIAAGNESIESGYGAIIPKYYRLGAGFKLTIKNNGSLTLI